MKPLLLSLLIIFCLLNSSLLFGQTQKHLLDPNQPEQDACNAIILCGNSFYTPYSFQGTGKKNDLNNCPCGGGEDNSMWLTITVNTSGILLFRIVPQDRADDYDFAVLNTTNATCDKVNSGEVVRCNFNANENNSGTIGLSTTSNLISVVGGTSGSNFCKYINAVAGETYMLMINNFGHDANPGPSSGFTIDFAGSTATFNQPPPPAMDTIKNLSCSGTSTITLHLTNDALCTSIAPDGSDFSVSPKGIINSAAGVNCNGTNGYTNNVVISFSAPLTAGTYIVSAKQGNDVNTILGLCGSALILPQSASFVVPAPPDTTVSKYICYNQLPYAWNGIFVTKEGDSAAIFKTTTVLGCDSTVVLNLIVSDAAQSKNDSAEICLGRSFTLPWDSTINTAGIFSHTYKNKAGCDSLLLKIKVKVDTLTKKNLAAIVCGAQNYKLPWDSIISKTGIYLHIFHNKIGCDSLLMSVDVKFNLPSAQNQSITLCGPQSYKLPWDSSVNRSGKYFHTYHFTSGCDSIYSTFTVIIDSVKTKDTGLRVCGKIPYKLPWDSTITAPGKYTHVYQYKAGCDSLILNISVKFDTLRANYTSVIACNVASYNLPWDSVVNTSGTYSHMYHFTTGCDSFINTLKIFFDVPNNIKRSYAFCQDSSAVLSAGNDFDSYQWSTGATTSSINVTAAGIYTVQATDSIGCYALDTFKIAVYPKPVSSLQKNISLCAGSTKTIDAGKGFANYLWNTGSSTQTIQIFDGGNYWVTVRDGNNCTVTDTIAVASIALPVNFLPADTIKCFYDVIVLKPYKAFNAYRWSTGYIGSAINVSKPGTYSLKVTDNYGCVGEDSSEVKDSMCREFFYIPSAFTPNSDGKNDVFRPAFKGIVSHYSFVVYDRWGQKVFTSLNPAYGWDGTINGKSEIGGVYVWICSYELSSQQVVLTQKGTVVLMR